MRKLVTEYLDAYLTFLSHDESDTIVRRLVIERAVVERLSLQIVEPTTEVMLRESDSKHTELKKNVRIWSWDLRERAPTFWKMWMRSVEVRDSPI